MKKYRLEITVFLCGAICMMIELVAARVLSPYVGSSNLIWTIIIGIMLTSMSVGYWLGGKIADRKPDVSVLSLLLLAGAVLTSIIPILETLIVRELTIVGLNIVVTAIISSILLFGLPSFILTTISPYAVKLKDKNHETIGKVSGRISSLSTVGSIFGTFLAGFVLIPNLGVRTLILSISIVLIFLSIMLWDKKSMKYFSLIVLLTISVVGLNYIGKVLFETRNTNIIEDTDSQYSRIWVRQMQANNMEYKTLQVDTGLESYYNQTTDEMGARYLQYYDLASYFVPNTKKSLMIGGAAYTYPMHYLKKYPNKKIDVVEIDNKMTKIAQEQFGLDVKNPNLKIYHQDGRSYLNNTKEKYDAIFIDAFKGTNAPFELTTYEALNQAKKILNKDGVVITNIISALEGENAKFIEYEYTTYKKVFEEVYVYKVVADLNPEQIQNLILVGRKGMGQKENRKQYEELLQNQITPKFKQTRLVTDHYAPIGT